MQATSAASQIDLNNVTVPGLFGMARNALIHDQIVDNGTEFNFDSIYLGYARMDRPQNEWRFSLVLAC